MRYVHYYIYMFAALLTLSACSDFNDKLDGYNSNDYRPTDIKELTLTLSNADYESIGTLISDNSLKSAHCFASQKDAQKNIPKWLTDSYPTADPGSTAKVTYKYTSQTEEGTSDTLTTTAPFELTKTGWVYNPSVTVTIPNVKQDPTAYKFYQAACDWVWANVDQAQLGVTQKGQGYVVRYGNTEYYAGNDRYNSCVDWQPASARAQIEAQYKDMTDEEVVATMQKRFIDIYAQVLPTLYPDAKPAREVEVIYTINFTAKAPSATQFQIQYKVTDTAQFTYIEGSLKPVN